LGIFSQNVAFLVENLTEKEKFRQFSDSPTPLSSLPHATEHHSAGCIQSFHAWVAEEAVVTAADSCLNAEPYTDSFHPFYLLKCQRSSGRPHNMSALG